MGFVPFMSSVHVLLRQIILRRDVEEPIQIVNVLRSDSLHNFAVSHNNDAIGSPGDGGIVSDNNEGSSSGMQFG